jgi:hypothetical protein
VAILTEWPVTECANPECGNWQRYKRRRYLGRIEAGGEAVCPSCGFVTLVTLTSSGDVLTTAYR